MGRWVLGSLVVLALAAWTAAHAQVVYVPHGPNVVAVPIAPGAPEPSAAPAGEPTAIRVDALPEGAHLLVDGQRVQAVRGAGALLVLAPGPHRVDVVLADGRAIQLTIVVPTESSGYQVIPRR
ncbi:MAG TPA: hypothetical protein VEA38_12870 [Terriglobales bacterium]|nr:hypothetical protein [Terriglobales bacterium]